MTCNGHVLGRVVFAYARFVLLKDGIQDPEQTILDAPVATNRLRDNLSLGLESGNIVTTLFGCFAIDLSLRFDDSDGEQIFPFLMAFDPVRAFHSPPGSGF